MDAISGAVIGTDTEYVTYVLFTGIAYILANVAGILTNVAGILTNVAGILTR
jgi:hypothetical protein